MNEFIEDFIYYLCCCGCCGLFRRKVFVKPLNDRNTKRKAKTLRDLRDITPLDKKRISSGIEPKKSNLGKLTAVHVIPNDKFKTEGEVIQDYGYKIGKYIDSGKYGIVSMAIHLQSNEKIACKVVELSSQRQNQKNIKAIRNELMILQRTSHPYIIKMIENFIIKENTTIKLYVFMQYASSGTLSALIQRFGPFDEKHCRLWFAQMLSALRFMHEKGIAHRDLKSQNILLDNNNHILISDFGLSSILMDPIKGLIESKTCCGTMPYMAPEVLEKRYPQTQQIKEKKYNAFLVDVWALGIILFQLFNKDLPFATTNINKALIKMRQKKWRFAATNKSNPSTDLHTILKKMLEPDPSSRPTMSKLTKYAWIKDTYRLVEQNNLILMETSTEFSAK